MTEREFLEDAVAGWKASLRREEKLHRLCWLLIVISVFLLVANFWLTWLLMEARQ